MFDANMNNQDEYLEKYVAEPEFNGLSGDDKVYVLEFVPEMPTTVRNL